MDYLNESDILAALQERMTSKLEELRHEYAQTILDEAPRPTDFGVWYEDGEQMVAGPFRTQKEAEKARRELIQMDLFSSSDIEVLTVKDINSRYNRLPTP